MRKIIFIFLLFPKYSFAQYATFQGSVYQPVRENYSLLQQSFDRIEQR